MSKGNREKHSPIIKDRVKKLLKEKKITQKNLAHSLNISPEHLNRCLNEGSISTTWLLAIAHSLDTSYNYLSGVSDVSNVWEDFDDINNLQNETALINYISSIGYDPLSTDTETLSHLLDEITRFIQFRCDEVLKKDTGSISNRTP